MLVIEEVHHARRPVTHGDEVRGRPVQTQQAQGGALLHAVHGVSERRAAMRQAWPRAHGQPPRRRSPRTTPRGPQGTEPTDNPLGAPRGGSPQTTPRGPQGMESTDNTLGPPGDGVHGQHPEAPRRQRRTREGAGGAHMKRLLRVLHAIKLGPASARGDREEAE